MFLLSPENPDSANTSQSIGQNIKLLNLFRLCVLAMCDEWTSQIFSSLPSFSMPVRHSGGMRSVPSAMTGRRSNRISGSGESFSPAHAAGSRADRGTPSSRQLRPECRLFRASRSATTSRLKTTSARLYPGRQCVGPNPYGRRVSAREKVRDHSE